MKRHGNLYEDIISIENLRLAAKKASKNKNKQEQIDRFYDNEEWHLHELHEKLRTQTFTTSEYHIFKINDRGKQREIYDLPFYPDRIVHWAIMLKTEQIFMRTFIYDSYAAITNKGGHKALKRARGWVMDHPNETKYCLKIDVEKFFPNISQEILSKLLRKKFKDKRLLWLFDDIVFSTDSGLPIGNYTSQYLGNFYTNYFDHYCKEVLRVKFMQKYMDDYIFFGEDKKSLNVLLNHIKEYLKKELGLSIKNNYKILETRKDGIDFVGYRNYGEYVLLRKSIAHKTKRAFRGHLKFADHFGYLTEYNISSIASYMGWLRWCNSYNMMNMIHSPLVPYINKYHQEVLQ